MKKEILRFIVVCLVIGAGYGISVVFSQISEQEKVFTNKCHEEGGVVVEEHGTNDLLCFPTDA